MGEFLAAAGASSGTAAGTSAATSAATTAAATSGVTGAVIDVTGTAMTGGNVAFTNAAYNAGGSLLSNAFGWASVGSSIMQGISGYREGQLKEKQLQIQANQSELQALQESNRIRENLLENMATARTQFGKAGAGGLTPMAIQEKSTRLAQEDINNVNFMNQIQQGQMRANRLAVKDESAMSLLGGAFGAISGLKSINDTNRLDKAINRLNNIRKV